MVYYTNYKLSLYNDDKVSGVVKKEISDYLDKEENEDIVFAVGNFIDEQGDGEDCKWYEHDKDMIKMSLVFPDVIFLLEGEGEESGDIWKKYYKNGKIQICKAKMTFDDFDVLKLQ